MSKRAEYLAMAMAVYAKGGTDGQSTAMAVYAKGGTDGMSSKLRRAFELGRPREQIAIVDESDFLRLADPAAFS